MTNHSKLIDKHKPSLRNKRSGKKQRVRANKKRLQQRKKLKRQGIPNRSSTTVEMV